MLRTRPWMFGAGIPVLRPWWPTIALLVLGTASVILLDSVHSRSRDLLEQTVVALDNAAESRHRLLHAYLIHERQTAGDATFAQSSPLAELRAAEYALLNWLGGRSGIARFDGAPPADPRLLDQLAGYRTALDAFRDQLALEEHDDVIVRMRFSEAEQAAAALEDAIRADVTAAMRAEQRAYTIELTGWGVLLLLSLAAAAWGRRLLGSSEHRTRQTERRLSRLRAVAPVGIAECDIDGSVRAVNPEWARLTHQAEEDWIGVAWWNALAEPYRDRARSLWTSTDGPKTATVMEARLDLEGEDQDDPWTLVRFGVEDVVGGARTRVVTLTDITQQRRVEEQLHHVQRLEAVGRLAGGAAHDFNNLLTSIGGFATLAREQITDAEAVGDLDEIERAVARGQALTRQLLTFSRRNRSQPGLIDPAEVLADLRRMLERLVSDDVVIETSIARTPPVLADPTQLEQVITNLVINASDAVNGPGRIRITVEPTDLTEPSASATGEVPAGRYVLLSVADNGPGIPPELRERIFEPFFTTKERGKGTGLGLSTVWGIVRQIGGHIRLESAQGRGACFRVYLPAAEGVADFKPEETMEQRRAAFTGTALVVDDEDAVRRLTTRILELRGWIVVEAVNGEQALRVMSERGAGIDLVITDVMMRGMNGLELAERLRESGSDVPILFVSGYAGEDLDVTEGEFLEKPFSPPALLQAVDELMS
ncbi:MAG TPA: ATP-binding protein [Longimicrobiales bacterium]|nr:ATP-binding protein [Longimicrobiales bacterium]